MSTFLALLFALILHPSRFPLFSITFCKNFPTTNSQQVGQLIFRQTGLIEDVAEGTGPDFAVQGNDGSPITGSRALFHGNVASFLTQQHKPGAPQRPNQFAARHRWQMPAHPLTSMLVR